MNRKERKRFMKNKAFQSMTAATIVLAAAMTSGAFADPSEEAARFLQVPGGGEMFRGTNEQEFKWSELSEAFITVLGANDWGGADGSLPTTFSGYALDLNQDGKNEYFIKNRRGGSGGPGFFVLSEIQGAWKIILDFQGGFHVMPEENGWARIIAISRGGGGNYFKEHYRFEETSYRPILSESYERGVITRNIIPQEKK
jgi:hypothetical protein